jgi:predicted DNA binding CopG/RHH family protein
MEAPTGKIKYVIENDSTQKICYATLQQDGTNKASSKLSDAGQLPTLNDGRYKITVYYEGDELFGSFTSDTQYLVIGNQNIYPVLRKSDGTVTNTFDYGDEMCIDFYRYTKDANGKTTEEKIVTTTYPDGYKETITDDPGRYNDKTITVTIDGESKTFNYNYTVNKRPVEIGLSTDTLKKGEIEDHLPTPILIPGSSMMTGDSISDFVNLTFWYENKNSQITLSNTTDVGRYHGVLELKINNPKLKCYDITLYSSQINVISNTYDVHIKADECDGQKVGTINLSKPEKRQGLTDETLFVETNTEFKLTAVPIQGYKLDHWEITEGSDKKSVSDQTLTMKNTPVATSIKACFVANTSKVTIDDSLSKGGTFTIPDGFVSGNEYPVGSQLSFSALANDDVEPDYWIRKEGRKSYYTYAASLTLTVPEDDVILYPVFMNKLCKIELGDGITATYTFEDENQDTVTQTLKNGYKVPKGSEISLHTDDYQHYLWYVNDAEVGRNQDTDFTVTEDSKIELRPIEIANQPAPNISVSENTEKVSAVELPENWEWDTNDANKVLKRGEDVEATANYIGEDKDQYEHTSIVIKIKRSACDHKNVTVFKAQGATCEEDGHIEYRICQNCGKIFSDAECTTEIKLAQTITEHSLGHTPVTDNAREATCTQDGLTEGSHCSRCDAVFKAQKTIPAKGHQWDEGTVTKAPTETAAGVKTYKCKVCGAEKTEDIAALNKQDGSNPSTGKDTVSSKDSEKGNTDAKDTNDAKLKISKVTAKKNTKKITVKLNLEDATVKIKVGIGAYKKAKAKGTTHTLKLGYKLKKGTKITIKVTKHKFTTLKKTYKVK